jgi:hypothetical protein
MMTMASLMVMIMVVCKGPADLAGGAFAGHVDGVVVTLP